MILNINTRSFSQNKRSFIGKYRYMYFVNPIVLSIYLCKSYSLLVVKIQSISGNIQSHISRKIQEFWFSQISSAAVFSLGHTLVIIVNLAIKNLSWQKHFIISLLSRITMISEHAFEWAFCIQTHRGDKGSM